MGVCVCEIHKSQQRAAVRERSSSDMFIRFIPHKRGPLWRPIVAPCGLLVCARTKLLLLFFFFLFFLDCSQNKIKIPLRPTSYYQAKQKQSKTEPSTFFILSRREETHKKEKLVALIRCGAPFLHAAGSSLLY